MMSSPLVGAWELVSDTRQGVMVCSETHFSVTMASKNRQRIEEPTPEEKLEAYQEVSATGGTYSVSGSKLTLNREVNLKVNLVGIPVEAELTFDGDRMTFRSISGTTRPREDVWRKVG